MVTLHALEPIILDVWHRIIIKREDVRGKSLPAPFKVPHTRAYRSSRKMFRRCPQHLEMCLREIYTFALF